MLTVDGMFDLNLRPEFIYFIRAGEFVKIGRTRDVRRRIETLQIGNPHKLVLLGLVIGWQNETEYHDRFCRSHFRGEWFRFTKDIQEFAKTDLQSFNDAALEWANAHRRELAASAGRKMLNASLSPSANVHGG